MNKRIQELKHQASVWCDENIPEQFSEETNGYGSAWEEKFAEMIIKECASICELNGQSYKFSFTPAKAQLAESASSYCGIMIKKHFGVDI